MLKNATHEVRCLTKRLLREELIRLVLAGVKIDRNELEGNLFLVEVQSRALRHGGFGNAVKCVHHVC